MKMHHVQVDDEVFCLVKAHAEPLVDTFNSSLRRLLPLNYRKMRTTQVQSDIAIRKYPGGTPAALQQILDVITLILKGSYTRSSATNFIAKQHSVTPQTVFSKYCTQLGLTASQFDKIIEQVDLSDLRKILASKFPEHQALIEEVLQLT